MAESYNFIIDAGSDTVIDITYLPDGEEFDLTNYTAKLQVRRVSVAPVIIELTSPSDGITVDLEESKFYLLFTAEKTAAYFGSYSYDLVITNTNTGSIKRIVEGVVVINPLVTQ